MTRTAREGTATDGVAGPLGAKETTTGKCAAGGARRGGVETIGRVGTGAATVASATKDAVGTPAERAEMTEKAARGAALRTTGGGGEAGPKAGTQPGAESGGRGRGRDRDPLVAHAVDCGAQTSVIHRVLCVLRVLLSRTTSLYIRRRWGKPLIFVGLVSLDCGWSGIRSRVKRHAAGFSLVLLAPPKQSSPVLMVHTGSTLTCCFVRRRPEAEGEPVLRCSGTMLHLM